MRKVEVKKRYCEKNCHTVLGCVRWGGGKGITSYYLQQDQMSLTEMGVFLRHNEHENLYLWHVYQMQPA